MRDSQITERDNTSEEKKKNPVKKDYVQSVKGFTDRK